ncbi:MAG TPA: creatininase family protein [Candidatus Hydrogenedentes bacterium]|nr:creatininase family protein [Candidatus Hydrogenedentota bacterium]HPG69580.1 creatininase family protein [Candidatus Hydrogenedentota bacterium]
MARAVRFEQMSPGDLDEVLTEVPVAYVPLGTLEFHGWHMPLGFDALKAHAICWRAAVETGGVVLPPNFQGFGGGHREFPGSIMIDEAPFRQNLRITLERLLAMGFRVIVLLTGHYPDEQVRAVKALADEVMEARPDVVVIALPEYEAYPNEIRADHAAQWETSIALYLMPELVDLARLDAHSDPLYGIGGEDPRTAASAELGQETVDTIVRVLARVVHGALRSLHSSRREPEGEVR